ncbi:hypothetical protein INR49_029503 [Caranx melampygus]|nr:hypothetical protein INR49_029503 [Caranx melampygus]
MHSTTAAAAAAAASLKSPNFSQILINKVSPPVSVGAMAEQSWWKLTFSRKKKSEPKVLYEIPAEYGTNTGNKEHSGNNPAADHMDSQFNARLEKIVDKSATKGRHVKVSHSGRFKEKKKVRATLSENPNLFADDENHKKKTDK